MIYAQKERDCYGNFCDAEGVRWSVFACRRIRTDEGVNVGWTAFASLEDSLTVWRLHSYIDEEQPLASPIRPTT